MQLLTEYVRLKERILLPCWYLQIFYKVSYPCRILTRLRRSYQNRLLQELKVFLLNFYSVVPCRHFGRRLPIDQKSTKAQMTIMIVRSTLALIKSHGKCILNELKFQRLISMIEYHSPLRRLEKNRIPGRTRNPVLFSPVGCSFPAKITV